MSLHPRVTFVSVYAKTERMESPNDTTRKFFLFPSLTMFQQNRCFDIITPIYQVSGLFDFMSSFHSSSFDKDCDRYVRQVHKTPIIDSTEIYV